MNDRNAPTAEVRGLADELATNSLLGDLRREFLDLLAGCSRNIAFTADERIMSAGQPADRFWLIRHGRVDIEIDGGPRGTIVIDRLDPGELLGVSWIAEPYLTEFDATAVERGSAIVVDAACLRAKCNQDHELGHELYRRFAIRLRDRLHATRLQLLDIYRPGA
ncbi:MAG: cyclic nucleotide-binding domain-containing protein [Acidimicrobiia bacterium]|nr:cyclic nucleotide-binding domain-containing protein [Acidimicrobiia bacterium]